MVNSRDVEAPACRCFVTTGKQVPVSLSDNNFLSAGYGGTRQFIEIKQWIDAIALRLRANPYFRWHSPDIASANPLLRAGQPRLPFLHAHTLSDQMKAASR
jgi:hypothetical protein